MRDSNRIDEFTEKLNKLWHQNPDLRFGQIIEMLKHTSNMTLPEDPFFIEDNEWINIINERIKERRQ